MSGSISKRKLLRMTAAGVSLAPLLIKDSLAQTLDPKEAEKNLYPAPGLPGGGQMEVRMVAERDTDPDIEELSRRLQPFNPESWHNEHARLAQKNEDAAAKFEADGRKVTAAEYFLRAAGFWRSAVIYLPEADARMLPT